MYVYTSQLQYQIKNYVEVIDIFLILYNRTMINKYLLRSKAASTYS